MKKFLLIIIFISLAVVGSSCEIKKKTSKSTENKTSVGPKETTTSSKLKEEECPPDLVCTMDYRTISVKLNSVNKNIVPDEYRVFLSNNQRIILRNATIKESLDIGGHLVIAEDANMSNVSKSGSKVTLVVYAGGEQIIKENYIIGHDCCHIKLIDGPKEINY